MKHWLVGRRKIKTAYGGVIVCHLALIISLCACTSPTPPSGTFSIKAYTKEPSVESTQQNNVNEKVENNFSAEEVITPENADQVTILDRINTGISVYSLTFSPDGRILATGGEGVIKLWDTASREALRTLEGHNDDVLCLTFSPDGRMLASGGWQDNTLRLWDTASGEALGTLAFPTNNIYDLAFSPDGSVLAAVGYSEHVTGNVHEIDDDETIILWEVETWQLLRSFDPDILWVQSLAFSPDGRILAAGGYKGIVLWDTVSWEILHSLNTPSKSLAFSPDGRILAAGYQGIVLWDAVSWELLHRLNEHTETLAFSPDGRLLASATFGQDETLMWGIP